MVGLLRVAANSDGSRHRFLGAADAQPLSNGRLLSLQRWTADLDALASGAPANRSLAEVLQTPQLLSRVGGSPANAAQLAATVGVQYGVQYGGQLAQLSALYFNNHTSFRGVDNMVLGGFSAIPQRLAAALGGGATLRLDMPVAAIAHGDSNATVYTAGGQALTAQYVVCSVPLGVLRAGAIALYPPLPEQTAAAVAALGVGRLEKLWLEFDSVRVAGRLFARLRWCCSEDEESPLPDCHSQPACPPTNHFKHCPAACLTFLHTCSPRPFPPGVLERHAVRQRRGSGTLRAAELPCFANQHIWMAVLHQHGRIHCAACACGAGCRRLGGNAGGDE